jgi:hypothetical protein
MDMLVGTNDDGSDFTVKASDLLTHGVILGRTGSGKTGATVTTVENAVMSGASAIILDPKGDLTNLALVFPDLAAEDFAPWSEEGSDSEKIAEKAQKELGHLAPNVRVWKDAADVTIYAPGKTHGGGKPINVLASFGAPTGTFNDQSLRDRASAVVSSVLSAVGHGADPLTDPANVFMTDVMVNSWKNGKGFPMEEWATTLTDPPAEFQVIDGLPINDFFPKKDRLKIARAVVGFRRQATKWLDGEALSIESYIGINKPKVSVFTMRHLNEGERKFFAAMLLSAIVDYMFRAPASNKLKLLVVLDEARGYLPPYPLNPPTKKPICTLLAQARAHGIGILIGTQNPNDLDYKALTNVGTWFLGKLRERDCARDLKRELSVRNVDRDILSTVPQQHFLVLKKDGTHSLAKIRWAYSYLRGPLSGQELLRLEDSVQTSFKPVQTSVKPVKPSYKASSAAAQVFEGSGDVRINFVLTDRKSGGSTVVVEHSINGGDSWRSSRIKNKSKSYGSTPFGQRHTVVWNTIKDVGRKNVTALVRLKINGQISQHYSVFKVNNTRISRFSSLFS